DAASQPASVRATALPGRYGRAATLHPGMSGAEETPAVRDDRPEHRFVLEQDGAEGELVYDVEDGRLFLLHTEVADALRGQGAGGQLVRAAVARAADDELTVVPWCPYARRGLRRPPGGAGAVPAAGAAQGPGAQP